MNKLARNKQMVWNKTTKASKKDSGQKYNSVQNWLNKEKDISHLQKIYKEAFIKIWIHIDFGSRVQLGSVSKLNSKKGKNKSIGI